MLNALQFETEIKGGAIETLTKIQEMLAKISQKTTITIAVEGLQDFQQFVQSDDFKNIAKNISSAFGGQKAKNVGEFFTNLRTEIEKVKNALKSDDYSSFMTQISQLTQRFAELNTEYQKFLKASGSKTGDDVITDMQRRLKDVERAIAQLQPAYTKLQQKQQKLEEQQGKLAKKQEEVANGMRRTTEEANKQSVAVSSLANTMNRYLSIYYVGRFAKELTQITGELELQKKSLEVIVGNANAANELYGTIRDMSQMSPYTFQDLMKSTRQLSAFGIETKDLYDTMKALSDIGAGLSVDVQRLILAYGHTRSYGYLSGIQNRQFETAGIDMIGGLVKRYNDLADAEERAGRVAERVTRKDVFKMMSKRDISFEDVNAVIMDLDREGGKFFNMQERQYETLGGKLRNLRNNWNIMMSEMGEMNKGILKGSVNLLNELTGNWEKYAGVIKALIIPLGALKLAMALVNTEVKKGVVLMNQAGWAKVKENVGNIFSNIGTALKSAGTWITAAIVAITALIQHLNKVNKKSSSLAETMREGGKNDELAIRSVMDTYGGTRVKRIQEKMGFKDGVQILKFRLEFDKDQLNSMNLTGAIEDVKEKLQALSPMYAGDLVDIASIKTQYEQFKAYMQKLEDLRYASDLTEAYSAAFELANKSSAAQTGFGRMFNDDFLTDVQDYQNSLRKSTDILQTANEDTMIRIDESMNGALTRIKQSMGYVDLKDALRDYMLNIMNAYNVAADEAGAKSLGQIAGNRGVAGLSNVILNNKNGWASKNPELAGMLPDQRGMGDFFAIFNQFLDPGLFARYLDEQRAEMYKGAKPFADTIMDVIRTNYGDNTEAAINYVAAQLKTIKTQSGATDQTVIDDLYDAILSYMGEEGKKYAKAFDREKVVDRFNAAIANKIDARTTEQEADKIREKAVEGLKDWAVQVGIDLAEIGGEDGELFVKAMAAAMSEVKLLTNWQERLVGPNGIIKINNALVNDIKKTYDIVEGAGLMQTAFDDFMKNFDVTEGIAQGALKAFFGTDYNVSKLSDEVKQDDKQLQKALEERADILGSYVDNFRARIKDLKGSQDINKQKEGELMENRLQKEVEPALQMYQMILEVLRAMAAINAELNMKGKDKPYKAEFEKRWDERIRIMKEAYDWYDKWEKKVGHDKALEKVNERYQDIFEEWRTDAKIPLQFDVKEIKDYEKYVEQIRDAALDLYHKNKNNASKNNGQEALRVYRQAVAMLTDINFDKFTRAAEDFSSIIEKALDDMEMRWDLFNSVLQATRDRTLAYNVAGLDGHATDTTIMAHALRKDLEKAISDAGFDSIPMNIMLDKEAIRHALEDAMPDGSNVDDYAFKMEGLITMYERWQKAEQDLLKTDAQSFSQLIGGVKTYDKQVSDINDRVREQIAANMRLRSKGRITASEEAKANKLAVSAGDYDKMKLTANYVNMFNNAIAMTSERFDQTAASIDKMLDEMLKLGSISAEEYRAEKQRVRQARGERFAGAASAQGAAWMGGQSGLAEYYYKLADEANVRYANGWDSAKEDADKYEQMGDSAKRTAEMMNQLTTTVQKLQSAMNMMSDFFGSIGNDDMAHAFSNEGILGSMLSGVSSGSAFGPYGAIIGGVLGTVSGVFKEEHYATQYNIRQRELMIEQLQGVNDRLDKLADRQFGYGRADAATLGMMGDYLQMSQMSQLPGLFGMGFAGDTEQAMQKAIESGSLYQTEYASLMMQRDKLKQNLADEEGDKNGSEEQIEEYKNQIADLEEQIANFGIDLAKELWDIDIKGWADQIGDALMNAFENGENAAKAYEDTVRSIMQQVTSQMMKVGILEPMMQRLQEHLFGTKNAEGKMEGGVVDSEALLNDPEGSGKKLATEAKKWMDGQGQAMITAAREFYEGMNSAMGGGLTNPSTKTLSSSIQGTSEEVSDLLAGYVNAMRQDVAADRIMMEQWISEVWPTYIAEITAGMQTMNRIDQNVASILALLSENGALYSLFASMSVHMDRMTTGVERVYVN